MIPSHSEKHSSVSDISEQLPLVSTACWAFNPETTLKYNQSFSLDTQETLWGYLLKMRNRNQGILQLITILHVLITQHEAACLSGEVLTQFSSAPEPQIDCSQRLSFLRVIDLTVTSLKSHFFYFCTVNTSFHYCEWFLWLCRLITHWKFRKPGALCREL